MQLVQFSNAVPFVVDDEVAEALLDYARSLATYRRHDLVSIPARAADTTRITVTLLIGPDSAVSTRTASMLDPVDDPDSAADLLRRSARLQASLHHDVEPVGLD